MEIRDSSVGSGYSVAGAIRAPPPEERLGFLRTLQRVLKEGDFTATYKFALLQALLDIAVESRIRNDAELPVSYRQLAERFIEYYWGHTEPYRPGMEGGGVLAQSAGKQAAVLRLISEVRGHSGSRTLAQLRRESHYPGLLSRVAKVIRQQPVRYIQNLNGGRIEFLFAPAPDGMGIVLKRGVAWCLQEFYDLLQSQVRAGWVQQVRSMSRNASLIGGHKDLEEFLFGQQRMALVRIRERLVDLEGPTCFYCEKSIAHGIEVDHFVPWSRYPHDRGHNFVLAHATCNHSKRDTLAGRHHLERWLARIDDKAGLISDALSDVLVCDAGSSRKVAQWAYLHEIHAAGMFWAGVAGRSPVYQPVDDALRSLVVSGFPL